MTRAAALEEQGPWDPKHEYWGEEHVPLEAWDKAIIARGIRPEFEMEQVLRPVSDPPPVAPVAGR